MQPSKSSPAAGFTLIGLLVSIAVAAILAGVALNAMVSWSGKAGVGMAGIHLIDSVNRARSLALIREGAWCCAPAKTDIRAAKAYIGNAAGSVSATCAKMASVTKANRSFFARNRLTAAFICYPRRAARGCAFSRLPATGDVM